VERQVSLRDGSELRYRSASLSGTARQSFILGLGQHSELGVQAMHRVDVGIRTNRLRGIEARRFTLFVYPNTSFLLAYVVLSLL
jgi:hypothetical protein